MELEKHKLSYKLFIVFTTIKGLAMPNDSTPDTAQPSKTAKTAASAAKSRTSTPAAISAAKPTPKPRVKNAVKPDAKRAHKSPAKAAEKTARKPAQDQEATKKGRAPKADKNAKPKKAKLVRDSFTMPEQEYGLIAEIKKRCVAKGLAVKKSEVLRAAITNLAAQNDANVMAALLALEAIKTGRPPKGQK
jgi:hypothetical protein